VLGMVKNVPSFWEMSLGFVIKLEWLPNEDVVNGEKQRLSSFPNAGRKQVRQLFIKMNQAKRGLGQW
jgi:hypothetical protein